MYNMELFIESLEERNDFKYNGGFKSDHVFLACANYVYGKIVRSVYPDKLEKSELKKLEMEYKKTYDDSGMLRSKKMKYLKDFMVRYEDEILASCVLGIDKDLDFPYIPPQVMGRVNNELLFKMTKTSFNKSIDAILSNTFMAATSTLISMNSHRFDALKFIINNSLDGMINFKEEVRPLLIGDAVSGMPVNIYFYDNKNVSYDNKMLYFNYALSNISRNLDILYSQLSFDIENINGGGMRQYYGERILKVLKNMNLRIISMRENVLKEMYK